MGGEGGFRESVGAFWPKRYRFPQKWQATVFPHDPPSYFDTKPIFSHVPITSGAPARIRDSLISSRPNGKRRACTNQEICILPFHDNKCACTNQGLPHLFTPQWQTACLHESGNLHTTCFLAFVPLWTRIAPPPLLEILQNSLPPNHPPCPKSRG